ncbi:MAG: helix-turn-helix transcriptional regulator [Burkholderiales bacterium]|nr:helix-turn-helix transcriptional regulator [Burkholderiales bacterium]
MSIAEIGATLRQARKAKKLTLKQLAQQSGVHFTTLSALERGTIPELGVRKLLRVAETLGLELTLRPYGQRYTLDDLAAERATITRSVQADPPPLAKELRLTSHKSELEGKGRKPSDVQSPRVYTTPPTFLGCQTNALAAALDDYNKNSLLGTLGRSTNALNTLTNVALPNTLGSQPNPFAATIGDYNKNSLLGTLGSSANALAAQQDEYDKLRALSKFDSAVSASRNTDLLTRALGRQTDQSAAANALKSIKNLPKKPR